MLLERKLVESKEGVMHGTVMRGGGRACLCWIGWVVKSFGVGDGLVIIEHSVFLGQS